MNSSNYRFTLDMHSAQSQVSIPVMLGDTGRTLRINLSDGSDPYFIADGCLAKISIKRPTETRLEEFCSIENNTTIVYPFSQNENTCAVEGIHECDVTLYGSDGNVITSPRFTMVVSERVVRSDDIVITDEDQTILDAMVVAEIARKAAEADREAKEKSRQETATQFDSALKEATEAARKATAAKDSIVNRFAGEVWEDKNMNLYSGDCHPNNGANGVDTVTGKCNALLNSGGGNNISGNHNLISGALNTVDAENCLVNGIWNEARLVTKMVNGVEHTYGHRAALLGRGLISNANDQVWVGRWNVPNEGVLFGVGAGTSDSDRFSAFRVYPKGTATIGHDPIGDMDVVTKRFLYASVLKSSIYKAAFVGDNDCCISGPTIKSISGSEDIAFIELEDDIPFSTVCGVGMAVDLDLGDYAWTTCHVLSHENSCVVLVRTGGSSFAKFYEAFANGNDYLEVEPM